MNDDNMIRYPVEAPPDNGTAFEIADGILWIRMPLPMALDHVNVFAIDEGDSWTLIDTAMGTSKSKDLFRQVMSGPLAGKPIKRAIITHHHPDHIGLAGWLRSEHGTELMMTRTAYLMARMLALDVQERPTKEALDFYESAGASADILEKRRNERPFNFADVITPLPLGFTRIQDGDSLKIGGKRWTVRVGHGHAPEHATLWCDDAPLVLGGDQLLPSISPNLGVYPTEPLADPVGDWLASCRQFKPLAKTEHLVLPGHKLPFYGLPKRLDQLIENHTSALDRLEAFLATPATAEDCFHTIFKRDIGPSEYGLALVEAVAHCQHLWHIGKANRTRGNTGAWLYQTR